MAHSCTGVGRDTCTYPISASCLALANRARVDCAFSALRAIFARPSGGPARTNRHAEVHATPLRQTRDATRTGYHNDALANLIAADREVMAAVDML